MKDSGPLFRRATVANNGVHTQPGRKGKVELLQRIVLSFEFILFSCWPLGGCSNKL